MIGKQPPELQNHGTRHLTESNKLRFRWPKSQIQEHCHSRTISMPLHTSKTDPQSHPFSLRKTSTNFSISKRWVCPLPLCCKLCSNCDITTLLAVKQPENRFRILRWSRTLVTLLKEGLVFSFLSIMTLDTHKLKKAEKANKSQVTVKTTQGLKKKVSVKPLLPLPTKLP